MHKYILVGSIFGLVNLSNAQLIDKNQLGKDAHYQVEKTNVTAITTLAELKKSLTSGKPTILTINASPCTFCKKLRPTLDAFSLKHPEINVIVFDATNHPKLENYLIKHYKYSPKGNPASLIFDKHANKIHTLFGFPQSIEKYEQALLRTPLTSAPIKPESASFESSAPNHEKNPKRKRSICSRNVE